MGEVAAFPDKAARRTRTPVRRIPLERRRNTFDEVTLSYTPEEARREAARCIQCAHPFCEEGCPARSPIRTWIRLVAEADLEGAHTAIRSVSNLPAICGRVCPVERQCEGACVMGRKGDPIAIGMLERFVADGAISRGLAAARPRWSGRHVAIVGSGPAGLTAAGDLAERGHAVSVFEALPVLGGILAWGIPAFVLPRRLVAAELARLARLGVRFWTRAPVAGDRGLHTLFRIGIDAVVLCVGVSRPRGLGLPGEGLEGVYQATDFLMLSTIGRARFGGRRALPPAGARVAVIGGGNTAMDVARTAVRLGAASVQVVYRRGLAEMPARADEIERAQEEGVEFVTSVVPVAIRGDRAGRVAALECARTSAGPPGPDRRPVPVTLAGSHVVLPTDAVVLAIGYSPDPWLARLGLDLNADGTVRVDAERRASRPGVFAAGDVAHGPDRVVTAMAAAKRAARAADEFVTKGV